MDLIGGYTFKYDLSINETVTDCTINPSEISKKESPWLYAQNTKYNIDDRDEFNPAKIGKWMIFLPHKDVDRAWNKVKQAVAEGHLWSTKVSTYSPSITNHVIIIYTKDCSDTKDVINVLDYLEKSGLKPPNTIIYYKTDAQTYGDIYSYKNLKASVYSSDTIRIKYGPPKKGKGTLDSWLKRDGDKDAHTSPSKS